jgi:hypothetical protein
LNFAIYLPGKRAAPCSVPAEAMTIAKDLYQKGNMGGLASYADR